jgi:hypothetical protein
MGIWKSWSAAIKSEGFKIEGNEIIWEEMIYSATKNGIFFENGNLKELVDLYFFFNKNSDWACEAYKDNRTVKELQQYKDESGLLSEYIYYLYIKSGN